MTSNAVRYEQCYTMVMHAVVCKKKKKNERRLVTWLAEVWNGCSPLPAFSWIIFSVGKLLPLEREINPDFHFKALWIEPFSLPSCEKRVEGDCRSSLQWYAGRTGLLSYRSNTLTERISSFLLKRGMRSLGFLCKVNSEARHIMFKIQAYPRRALETHCASRGTCFPLCKEAPGLK